VEPPCPEVSRPGQQSLFDLKPFERRVRDWM